MILLDGAPVASLEDYVERGGGVALRLAVEAGAEHVLDELEASGLRGRGGAGFSTGLKWRSIIAGGAEAGERFVVANGAEGEPGTFKDRALLRHNPYLLLEGLLVAARTVGARRVFVALKSSFEFEADVVALAAAEMAAAGWADDVQIDLVRGPDEYLFGEEKALLEVIEGEEPLPRLFPPYLYGLFTMSPQVGWSAGRTLSDVGPDGSNPTLVNNVETLMNVPSIVLGRVSSNRRVFCLSGAVNVPGVYEVELGLTLGELITLAGGVRNGSHVQAVLLGGAAGRFVGPDAMGVVLDHDSVKDAGLTLGSGVVMVHDQHVDLVDQVRRIAAFFRSESCGQCVPCRVGTVRQQEVIDRLVGGTDEFELLADIGRAMTDASICGLGQTAYHAIESAVALDVFRNQEQRP